MTCPSADDQDEGFRWPGPNRDHPGDQWHGQQVETLPDIADYHPSAQPDA